MAQPQLRLITEPASTPYAVATDSADPVLRVFQHWVFMSQRRQARTKLGPTRRQAINAALLLYSEEDLQMAIEGNLVDEWCITNDRHDIEWLLQGEGRIERFMDLGENLRLALQRRTAAQHAQAADASSAVQDPAAAEAARESLREFVRSRRGQLGGR